MAAAVARVPPWNRRWRPWPAPCAPAGSAGPPKAVLHTQRALAYKARVMAAVHGLGPDDAVLMPAPLAHISGLLNGVLVPGVAGMKSVLMGRWDPEAALRTVEDEAVSFM